MISLVVEREITTEESLLHSIAYNELYIFSSCKILSLYMYLISVNDYLDFNYKMLHEPCKATLLLLHKDKFYDTEMEFPVLKVH